MFIIRIAVLIIISCTIQCDKKQDDTEEIQGSWRYKGRPVEKSFLYEVKTVMVQLSACVVNGCHGYRLLPTR